MAALTFSTFLANLRTDLEARANLAGVKVRTLPQNPDENPGEGISFDEVLGGHEWHTMGPKFREEFDVRGRMWAIAAETGGEPGSASRNRAAVFLEELTAICEDNAATIYTGTDLALAAKVESFRWRPFSLGDGSWMSEIEFTVSVVATV